MSSSGPPELAWSCPRPLDIHTTVQMAHGGGGRLMRDLVHELFLAAFSAQGAGRPPHDSAVLSLGGMRLAFTTDSFVVSPLFFPGGDIGKLAVFGTVNDLAMAGAKPQWLSAAFVLEEGFPLETLRRIVASMQGAAQEAGVAIVTGDTKVVDRGKGDGVYVNTAGIGIVPPGVDVSPQRVRPGDAVFVSGDLGRHGIAILSVREGLSFEGTLGSDCAPLSSLVESLTALGTHLHCLRDLTRGGLAAALNEIALDAGVGIELEEEAIPVAGPVASACELLGLDPLYLANEGRLVAFVSPEAADRAWEILIREGQDSRPACIGRVMDQHRGIVAVRNALGGQRIVDLLLGDPLPRIC